MKTTIEDRLHSHFESKAGWRTVGILWGMAGLCALWLAWVLK